ncbi:MAG: hypothetical protein COV75_01310 [Candidatus Omnitrophica bacterium CG11_big_fil_rev_8_21_14_0_20_63_9]|nr:MAG: hypothetical protein COV75_01310 [Candidatus Omnitrophica bacterium CG11_big_fil_rev_8_21_14_0_20_63_9]
MGWYLRKSFSSGPVRFNLSKSGVGMSFGVKGARLGIGPRGAYTHLGRGGLYYRSSYSGSGRQRISSASSSLQQRSATDGSPMERSTALFDSQQLYTKDLQMELDLKRSTGRDLAYLIIAVIALSAAGYFGSDPARQVALAWICAAVGVGLLCVLTWRAASFSFNKWKSTQLYKAMLKALDGIRQRASDLSPLKALIDGSTVQHKYRDFAFYRFYRDYMEGLLADAKLTGQESMELKAVEGLLQLDEPSAKTIKRWAFNKTYLAIIADRRLSQEEDENITRAKEILGLSNDDVQEELETLRTLREVRRAQEEPLTPIQANAQLAKNEVCFHQTRGRIVKERTLRSYQSGGQRYTVKDMAIEKEGDFYLTSARILLVGAGVTTIKLEKVLNMETDIDQNTISLDIDNRKTPLVLSVPDSYVVSAKLNNLLRRSESSVMPD